MIPSKELAVLVYLSHTDDQSVRAQGAIAVDSKFAVGVYPVSSPAQINTTLQQVSAQWFLLVSEHENVNAEVLVQFRDVLAQSPDTRLFVLQDEVDASLVNKPLSPFVEQLCGLSPVGLLFDKSFVLGLGGFNEKLTHAFDIDLFLRCTKLPAPPLAGIPKQSFGAIHRQVTASVFGAERVLQATELAAGLQGKASAYWFAAFAKRIESQMAQMEENNIERVKLQVHLAGLAYRIAHQVLQGDQAVLAPYLRRSVYDGNTGKRDLAVAVDECVQTYFDKPAQALVLPEALHCFALGQTPQCAQLLKQLGLKRVTGPLDWVNLNPSALLHILQNRFEEFLKPEYCQSSASGGAGALLRSVEHAYYRQHHGVNQMFSFHNLARQADLAQHRQAVEVMLNALKWNAPTLSVYLTTNNEPPSTFEPVLQALQDHGPHNGLLVVNIVHESDAANKDSGQGVQLEPMGQQANGVWATLPVFSQHDGTVFADAVDNVRLARLVHGVALGWFGQAT